MSGLDDALLRLLASRPGTSRSELIEQLREDRPLVDGGALNGAADRVLMRAHGLGPVEAFLCVPDITEIMINGPGSVWIDRAGELIETDVRIDADGLQVLIERIMQPLGLRVDRVSPVVDARLDDGSRVNVVVPPLAPCGPLVTIRRFSETAVGLDGFGGPDVTGVLRELVLGRSTIVVTGGTGSGKTTLLNALGELFDSTERVVVIEDTAELRLPGRHVVRLEARPANSEGVGEITIRQLVRNALRMRPDRIVVGEVRGGEALDLLLALNTGHRGSLSTCHANDPHSALRRLESLALFGGVDLPIAAIREQIAAGIDHIVHVVRGADGGRSVAAVAEVVGAERPQTRIVWSSKR